MLVKEFLNKLGAEQAYKLRFHWYINDEKVQVDTEDIEAAYEMFQDEEIGEESSIYFRDDVIDIYIGG